MRHDIKDLTLDELRSAIMLLGGEKHRASQIFKWVYKKNVQDFGLMTDLSRGFIEELGKKYTIGTMIPEEVEVSRDGTEKFLWRLADGNLVESVLIKESDRRTLCLSTQVGCRYKCPFCASGAAGFKRDLTVSEIVSQVIEVQGMRKTRITNIVFMGMGEPLDNADNVIKAIRLINHKEALEIGARKITVSTCGIIPGIKKLQEIGLQIELSVSLHAVNEELRNELVPANRKYPLEKLLVACRDFYNKTGRVITLEYAIIKGKNDSQKEAERLAKITRDLKAKVNLLSCNPSLRYPCEPGAADNVEVFRKKLLGMGVTVTYRKSKGQDISAACGQLAAKAAGLARKTDCPEGGSREI